MDYIILLFTALFSAVSPFPKKIYTDKNRGGIYFFTFVVAITAALCFFVSALIKGTLLFNVATLKYALMFGAAYGIATVASVAMYKYGPLGQVGAHKTVLD